MLHIPLVAGRAPPRASSVSSPPRPPAGAGQWQPAKVTPLLSETGLRLLPEEPAGDWRQWVTAGKLTERRAGGLDRVAIFNPYPEAQTTGRVNVDVRVQVAGPDGTGLATHDGRIQADNTDVVYLEDWSQVLQRQAVVAAAKPAARQRQYRTNLPPTELLTRGNEFAGQSPPDLPLPSLTYPLTLRGAYAIFLCTRARHGIGLRLSGDERTDRLGSRHPYQEMLWRWCRLDRQHLVVSQTQTYTGYVSVQLDYVKLVPLDASQEQALEAPFAAPRDKLVAGYFEAEMGLGRVRRFDPIPISRAIFGGCIDYVRSRRTAGDEGGRSAFVLGLVDVLVHGLLKAAPSER